MRCTRAGDADRAALRALWKQAFGDDDETIDAFFDTLFPLCDAFAVREGGALCAMLFCLPQTLVRDGREERAAYIYAVATDERWRHRGACRGLLQYAEKKLKSRGVVLLMLAALTPELGAMYEKLGFAGASTKFSPQRLPAPQGRAEVVSAVGYAGLRETLLGEAAHIRYDKPTLEYAGREDTFYLLDAPGGLGCAAVRRLPDGRLRADELLPDARALPALAAALGEVEIWLPEAGFYSRWLDGTREPVYAAFALD